MQQLDSLLGQIDGYAAKLFTADSSGHDYWHAIRVRNLAMRIQEKEGGDRTVIAVAASLHDVHRTMQNETGKYFRPGESLPKVKSILDLLKLPEPVVLRILHCIEFHEQYSFSAEGKTVTDIETLILQDADNLDAMGAIGIARTFLYTGVHNGEMYVPEKPFDKKTFDEGTNDPSTIHHFYSKLLKLKDNMNTPTALKMVEERHRFMELYLEQFFAEWNGER